MAVNVVHIQVLQGGRRFMKLSLWMIKCVRLVHGNAAEYELESYARQHSGSIRDDGLRKVLGGKPHWKKYYV